MPANQTPSSPPPVPVLLTDRAGPARRRVRLLDAAVVLWVVVWIGMGIAVGRQIQRLHELSDTVVTAGSALQDTSRGLRSIEQMPLVGGLLRQRIGQVTTAIDRTAREAIASGRDSRGAVADLSVLLGVSVGVIAIAPVLVLYLPFRIARIRDVRAVRRAVASGDDPALDRFLAHRALRNLPYGRLREIAPDPWGELQAGRYRALADAELARLGIPRARRP